MKTPIFTASAGFSLAELLMALLILGQIATFTIPKVLTAQQTQQKKAVSKETIAMISGAYTAYKLNQTAGPATRLTDLTPYMNYVRVDTVSQVDNHNNATDLGCFNAWDFCLRLHNGAVIQWWKDASFGGTHTTSAIWFNIDPDGKYSGVSTGPGKAVNVFLYYNGRITTKANILPNTCDGWYCYSPTPSHDPEWFAW